MAQNPRTAGRNCALYYHPDGFRVAGKAVKGRQSAGAGFLKGFIEHSGVDRLIALTRSRPHFDDFRALAGALDRAGRETVWARPLDRHTLRSAGTVYWPSPELDQQAWTRRFGDERDYSLCGVTHTVASAAVVAALGQYLTAPTQPWDSLVCTSTAVRAAVEHILEHYADYLARRGGGRFRSPVRLPVIPLGVDCDSYAPRDDDAVPGAGPGARRALRARLGIAEGDLAALFVGRLSFHAKAHPTPLYLAAARAAQRVPDRTIHLLLAGQFPNRPVETEFREAADRFRGAARVHFVDGSDGPHGPIMRGRGGPPTSSCRCPTTSRRRSASRPSRRWQQACRAWSATGTATRIPSPTARPGSASPLRRSDRARGSTSPTAMRPASTPTIE